MKKIIYLNHHEKTVTGGHVYNDAFETYLEEISGLQIFNTPNCSSLYRGWRKIYSPIAELKWLKEFKGDSFVFFGDTSYKYHFLLAVVNYFFCKTKTAVIIHHFLFIGTKGLRASINKWTMRLYYGMMTSIIVPSPYTLKVAKDLFPKKDIFYIPLPFEQKYNPSNNYEEGNILYVGTIESRKGLLYLVEAMNILDRKHDICLNVIGQVTDRQYFNALTARISELNLTSQVHFWGRVSERQLDDCYSKAEVFAFPSTLEGYGIVLIEALSRGVPVVCFNNTAMPYTIKDGYNGFVANNKDVSDFATKLNMLCFNKRQRAAFQKGIKETVQNLKTTQDFKNSVSDFFKNINSY